MARDRLFAILGAAILAAVVAGCGGGRFLARLPAIPGDYRVDSQPVELLDLTGLVSAIEPIADPRLPAGAWPDNATGLPHAATAVPGDALAVQVVWGAGMCEARSRLTFEDAETGYALRVESDTSLGGMIGCPAALVYRGITLRFREAVAPAQIELILENN